MPPTPATVHRSGPRWMLLICLVCMILEGYDVVAYGAALPAMLGDRGWNLTTAEAGLIGSLTPVGMMLGTLATGWASDRVGRRRMVLASVSLFSVAMLLCALAPSPLLFATGRLIVGIGAGGVLPSVAALVYEYSPRRRRHLNTAMAFAGYGTGGALAGIVAIVLVPEFGFRAEYAVGFVAVLVVLPAAARWLPESVAFLLSSGREDDVRHLTETLDLDLPLGPGVSSNGSSLAEGRVRLLLSGLHRRDTTLFSIATLLVLLVVFGLSTWLPQLMRSAGYPLGSALTFLVVLNLGTAIGGLLVAFLADRVGSKPATVTAFLAAALAFAIMGHRLPTPVIYTAAIIAGVGGIGTQILLNVYIASRYPTQLRATALGTTLAVGRLGAILGPAYGGWLLAATGSAAVGFYAFALPALLGALVVLMVKGHRHPGTIDPGSTDDVAIQAAEPEDRMPQQ